MPLIESLTDLRDSSDAATVKNFAADLVDRIEAGSTLSQAMAQSPWPVDVVIVSLVQTGEATGKLLDNNKNPSPRTGQLDNRGSQFYLTLYWACLLYTSPSPRD